MSILGYIVTVIAAYLLGSIPSGFMVARARGVDIRSVGSGNIGATNVFRYLGVPAGILVLLADALKGWLGVAVIAHLCANWFFPAASQLNRDWLAICGGLAAVLGHNYTCWLRFRGGKGIATSAGALAALVPGALVIILAVWIVVLLLTRYVSLASITASSTLPFASWATGQSLSLVLITSAMTVLAIYKHKANISRLMRGTENRLWNRKPAPPAPSDSSA